jgi:hypothetical protein
MEPTESDATALANVVESIEDGNNSFLDLGIQASNLLVKAGNLCDALNLIWAAHADNSDVDILPSVDLVDHKETLTVGYAGFTAVEGIRMFSPVASVTFPLIGCTKGP